ncbi:MAG: dihydroneopterin aldolase, partial [Verrucomicrobia bacterium]|nr:dihydroneopterin aldolase [Verrucomicrobiota bacterium]
MDRITLCDLEVNYRVGVTDAERTQPQRLLLTIKIEHDLTAAGRSDELEDTIDYDAITQRLLHF